MDDDALVFVLSHSYRQYAPHKPHHSAQFCAFFNGTSVDLDADLVSFVLVVALVDLCVLASSCLSVCVCGLAVCRSLFVVVCGVSRCVLTACWFGVLFVSFLFRVLLF